MKTQDTAKLVITRRRSLRLRRNQRFWWDLIHQNGNNLCGSKEGYANADEAERQAYKIIRGDYIDVKIVHKY